MQCPTCNTLNSATVVRCMTCGTTLIHEAAGHSMAYQEGARTLDAKLHTGIGSFFGFFLVAILLKFIFTAHWLSDREVYLAAVAGGVAGAIAGRLVLKARQDL
ncbi:hypothetical protein [Rhizobacter sp. Root1221]|uniref:hypothetical protein n=1 Tax=Rhizobacter sp. Root1221 TaxID=1736433 RepID=UPI0006F987CF|nr:hypothetical protein [Rhizobacter sp. Root1221]KQV99349.1 hypothetical protein ASC87_21445 [Rhizobacter sp. Root1221]